MERSHDYVACRLDGSWSRSYHEPTDWSLLDYIVKGSRPEGAESMFYLQSVSRLYISLSMHLAMTLDLRFCLPPDLSLSCSLSMFKASEPITVTEAGCKFAWCTSSCY